MISFVAYILTFFVSLKKAYSKGNNQYMPPRVKKRFMLMQTGFFVFMFMGVLLVSLEMHPIHLF